MRIAVVCFEQRSVTTTTNFFSFFVCGSGTGMPIAKTSLAKGWSSNNIQSMLFQLQPFATARASLAVSYRLKVVNVLVRQEYFLSHRVLHATLTCVCSNAWCRSPACAAMSGFFYLTKALSERYRSNFLSAAINLHVRNKSQLWPTRNSDALIPTSTSFATIRVLRKLDG